MRTDGRALRASPPRRLPRWAHSRRREMRACSWELDAIARDVQLPSPCRNRGLPLLPEQQGHLTDAASPPAGHVGCIAVRGGKTAHGNAVRRGKRRRLETGRPPVKRIGASCPRVSDLRNTTHEAPDRHRNRVGSAGFWKDIQWREGKKESWLFSVLLPRFCTPCCYSVE